MGFPLPRLPLMKSLSCLALVILVSWGCGPDQVTTRPLSDPPIIVIGLDTVRGDHMGYAGADGVATPHLDDLAADGVAFVRCQATAPWTGPAFASIFTGLLPYRHGFIGGNYAGLDTSLVTISEMLTDEGYKTGSFVAIKWLTDKFGMTQGVKEYRAFYMGRNGGEADEVTTKGLRFAVRYKTEPFYLFLHYYDAHAPYAPPGDFDRMYYEGNEKAPGDLLLDTILSDRNKLRQAKKESGMYAWLEGVTDWDYPDLQYDEEISFVDDHVGQVIAGLKKHELYDQALILVVGDHGEHMTEHDNFYTHALPYEEALQVPLIIKWPRGEFAGRVVEQRVSILDVLPTILGAMGRDIPEELDGRDLFPLAVDPEADHTSILVAEQGGSRRFHKTFTEGDWKLFLTVEKGEITRRLFDLAVDPGELADVGPRYPDRLEDLTRKLWAICDGKEKLVDREPVGTAKVDDKTREQLRSLGYIR